MKQIATICGVAALIAVSPARAADLSHSSSASALPAPTGVSVETVNWTGFNIGIEGGYMNANHEVDVPYAFPSGESGTTTGSLLNLNGLNSRGWIGGGLVGFDKQMGDWVAGVQAFYHVSNADTKLSVFDGDFTGSLKKDEEWGGIVRLGRLLGSDHRVLAYGLAGWDQAKYSLSSSEDLNSVAGLKTSNTFSGIIVGGGVEYALKSNLFLGAEYTHFFGGKETWFSAGEPGDSIAVTSDLDEDRIMATLKLKLNGALISY